VGVELALAAALYSARSGLPVPAKTAIAGELSLAGELRPIRRLPGRIRAGRSLGFDRFLGPSPDFQVESPASSEKQESQSAADIREAVKLLFGAAPIKGTGTRDQGSLAAGRA
jgi:DNA repair protein RadA/Sms